MSVGGISGSGYESMRARFESFRSGQTKIQKSDLEAAKTQMESRSSESGNTKEGKGSGGIDELIEKFSQIDTNGDGISADELDTAAAAGTITRPEPPAGGKPPGGMKGPPPGGPPPGGAPPGGAQGQQKGSGTSQSDLMGYDLFAEFKKKLAEDAAATIAETGETEDAAEAASTDEAEASSSLEEVTGQQTLDLLAMWGRSSKTDTGTGRDDSQAGSSKSRERASALVQQLLKAYQQQSGMMAESSVLGSGMSV